jgi:hypothetical protein
MPIKGTIKSGHIPDNLMNMSVGGLIPYPGFLPIVKHGDVEIELEKVEHPDKTHTSGGQVKPGSFDIEIPEHELEAQLYMEEWLSENIQPKLPTGERPVVLEWPSVMATAAGRTVSLDRCWPQKGKHMARDMGSDGKMTTVTWTICFNLRNPA